MGAGPCAAAPSDDAQRCGCDRAEAEGAVPLDSRPLDDEEEACADRRPLPLSRESGGRNLEQAQLAGRGQCSSDLVVEAESLDQPLGLAGALGVVGLGARDLLGDASGDEAEQGRALGDRGLDHRVPGLEGR
jgi:hypothetical protein